MKGGPYGFPIKAQSIIPYSYKKEEKPFGV